MRDLSDGFSAIPNRIIRSGNKLSPCEFRVLMALISYVNPEDDEGWCYMETLTKGQTNKPADLGCGFDKRYVRRVIAGLEKKGVVERLTAKNQANRFRIIWGFFDTTGKEDRSIEADRGSTGAEARRVRAEETVPTGEADRTLRAPEPPEKKPLEKTQQKEPCSSNPATTPQKSPQSPLVASGEETANEQSETATATTPATPTDLLSAKNEPLRHAWAEQGFRLTTAKAKRVCALLADKGLRLSARELLAPVSVASAAGTKKKPRWLVLLDEQEPRRDAAAKDKAGVEALALFVAAWEAAKLPLPRSYSDREAETLLAVVLRSDPQFADKIPDIIARVDSQPWLRDRCEKFVSPAWLLRPSKDPTRRFYECVLDDAYKQFETKPTGPSAVHYGDGDPSAWKGAF